MTLGDIKQVIEEIGGAGYADDTEISLLEGTDLDDAKSGLSIDGWYQPRTGDSNPAIFIH